MKRLDIKLTIVLTVGLLMFACKPSSNDTGQQTKPTVETTKTESCPALPATFKEMDLIGTWVTSYSLNDKDTLIIKEDGTYKQIYDSPDAGKRYESDWQEWRVEYRESGFIRLHLEGMRRCSDIDSICDREGGGVDPDLFTAIDYCEGEVIEMPDEIILIVTGAKDDPPRGILLRHARLAGSEWTWSFALSTK
jgi:hypothetical protein